MHICRPNSLLISQRCWGKKILKNINIDAIDVCFLMNLPLLLDETK